MKRFWKYLTVSLLSISLTTPFISNSQGQRTLHAAEEQGALKVTVNDNSLNLKPTLLRKLSAP